MAITNVHDQALAAMKRSNHTLVCFPEHASGDGVATAIGLARAIEGLRPGHQVDVISSGFHDSHRKRYQFLPGVERVGTTLQQLHELTIRVNMKSAKVDALRYDVDGDYLNIRLTPGQGQLTKEHIDTALSSFKYDLIIVVDCADLPQLGVLYAEHAQFFQTTPIIAIDHAPDHERYGQINLVDLSAVACGEVCATFLRAAAPAAMDADIATCFLTGILAATRSFRHSLMTPATFAVTAGLLEAGARREQIVQALFQTKTVSQLKLWGRCLTRLRHDADRGIVWTLLSQNDFLAAGAHEHDLDELIDELLVNAPEAQLILLCYETPKRGVCVIARSPGGRYDVAALLASLGGTGTPTNARTHMTDRDLLATEKTVLDLIREKTPAASTTR